MSTVPFFVKSKLKIKNSSADTGYTLFENGDTTTARTITIPNFAAITLARTNDTNTFAGIQTFSAVPVFTLGLDTVYGSNAANGDLTLVGTSSATKTTSNIYFGAAGAHGNIDCNTSAWTIGESTADVYFPAFGPAFTPGTGSYRSFGGTTSNIISSVGVTILSNSQYVSGGAYKDTVAAFAGCDIFMSYSSTLASTAIAFRSSQDFVNTANRTVTPVTLGEVTHAGAWTFPINTTHAFGSSAGNNASSLLAIRAGGTTRTSTLELQSNGKYLDIVLAADGSWSLNDGITANKFASITAGGAWTLGAEGAPAGTYKVGISGNCSSAATTASLLLTDQSSATSRQFALSNGYGTSANNYGNLFFLASTSVGGDVFSGTILATVTGAGLWYNYSNSVHWDITSDVRIKKDVREITGALDKICALHPVHFKYIHRTSVQKSGFLAQEFEKVLPGHVTTSVCPKEISDIKPELENELIKGLILDLDPYYVKAIQELNSKVETQQTIINTLTSRLEALESKG